MEAIHPRCGTLDIGKKSVAAYISIMGSQGKARKEVRMYSTVTREILRVMDWFKENGVEQVGMEATGSYWKPIWNLLESEFQLFLANPHHMKAIPGRKTDVKDAEWMADLLQHGLLPNSYVPERPQRELRELTRYRRSLVDERADEVRRIQKVLEGANIKLSSVASNVLGVSGRAILEHLANGVNDPKQLVELAKGRLKGKKEELAAVLQGLMQSHQRFMISRQLAHIADLETLLEDVEQEIGKRLDPFEATVVRLMTIPGIGRRIAEVIVAEVGTDVRPFPSAKHLAAWAGLAPGNKESAGKRFQARTRQGNHTLKMTMVEAAWAASRTSTYLGAQYRHLSKRLKAKKAVVAVAHSMIQMVYHVLNGADFRDLGPDHFDRIDRKNIERNAIKRLEQLGYTVKLEPSSPAEPAA